MNAFVRLLAALVLILVALPPTFAQQAPPAKEAPPVKPEAREEPIDFEKARALFRKRQMGEKLTAEEEAYVRRAMAARQAGQPPNPNRPNSNPNRANPPQGGKDKVGFKPLIDMTADDRYQGEDGGLYGQGKNTPPDAHRQAAEKELAAIQPLDKEGKPEAKGRIVLVSISMSNATQEFSMFKQLADRDEKKSARLTIVDCAQGGQAMAEWVPPQGGPWQEAARRIASAGVTDQQVQIAWVKLANKGLRGDFEEHGTKLYKDTLAVLQNAKARFPNLRIVYLGSRIYAGYSTGALNPEPYAYESGFIARQLILDQIIGEAALNYDGSRGAVKTPLLLWGPYFWADGVTPRSDGLVYKREDLSGDGVHPSQLGREKVARQLLDFFKTNPLAKSWCTCPPE